MDKTIEMEHRGIQLRVPAELIVESILERLGAKPSIQVSAGGVPRIGQPWPGQGGVYAGMMKGVNGVADYPLILATDSKSYLKDVIWGPRTDVPGATCEYDGLKNTAALIEAEGEFPAADATHKLVIDGHQDFYLPSRRELALLYANVPELVETGDWYWSSTQCSDGSAWCQVFNYGVQLGLLVKDGSYRVRAVRRVF